jgi:hypothetical protein
MYAVKLGYGFSIVCTVPMLLLPLRDTVTQLVSPTAPSAAALPSLHFQGLTAMILVTGLLIAGAVPNVEFVFGLTGVCPGASPQLAFPCCVARAFHNLLLKAESSA